MGKQKGDGARSKNRPSSSSLAASLLPTGTASIGFGGFVGSSRLDSSSFPNDDSTPFSEVDSEVAQHIKRLGRKDPTTKLKALTTLRELFKQKPGEEILQIIPQWAFEYKRLLLDYNREVRRATHETMTNLVIAAGRGLAPHLKSLMGPWWFSQFDPVSEISQAARRSLQDAFPAQEKRLEALILCTSEIFLYLEENLKLTPQNMSDKATPLDELEEMHQRVISSSLLALATLLDILLGMQLQRSGFENVASEPRNASKAKATAISSAEKIFSTHKYFLEFLKSKSPVVRSATYSALGSFIKHIPHAVNEENMKILSTAILGAFQEKDSTCHSSMWETILLFSKRFPESWGLGNTQKTVINRFWQFLRNGCCGSQQVSYPMLVPFLDTIPPKVIIGNEFFLNLFQNLWAGRNPSHSSSADRLAFFKAFKECFLWGIHNASRYFDGLDAVYHFQVSLVDNIIVNLLWHDFLLVASTKRQDRVSSKSYVENIKPSQGERMEKPDIKYSKSYMQDLGKCIIEILSVLSAEEHNLLGTFCTSFQGNCLAFLQQTEHLKEPSEHIDQIVSFLLLLEQHAVQRGETWPLVSLAGPMITKAFPLIRSLDSPDAVRILSISVSIFGPRRIVSQLSVSHEGYSGSHPSDEGHNDSKPKQFLQVFDDIFVPWCLHGSSPTTGARLDLLLTLLDDELFSEQWSSIITFSTRLVGAKHGSLDADHIDVLAMLVEKVRGEEICKRKDGVEYHRPGSDVEHWHHKLLDSTAVSVASCSPPFTMSHSRLLRAVLGGSSDEDQTSFVSRDSMTTIFWEVLKRFIPLLMGSSFTWAKDACSLILCSGDNKDSIPKCESHINTLEMAEFALEVLRNSFFCLKGFDGEYDVVSSISAAIFIVDWEYRMSSQIDKKSVTEESVIDDDGSHEKLSFSNIMGFGESLHAFRFKITSDFWKSLNICNLKRLESVLIQTIRSAIFESYSINSYKAPSLCCEWMLEVLEYICPDCYEEQMLLDQLLDEGKFWPLWVKSALSDDGTRSATIKVESALQDINVPEHHQFVGFIEKLISKLGFSRVIAGFISEATPPSAKEASDELVPTNTFSRSWLAAEVLCTWKWPGGSAVGSFLPLFSEFAKAANSVPEENLVNSIVNILLDGALLHGDSEKLNIFSIIWDSSGDEIETIQDPFLRALVSLLLTLVIKDNIWTKDKALIFFKSLVDKLYLGPTVNRNCLRILPFLTNVLIRPLRQRPTISAESSTDAPLDSVKENQIRDIIEGWLQTTLSLPPLSVLRTGQDTEEWLQVVISCYPLSAIGGICGLKMALQKDVNHSERTLLLDLFRKHRFDDTASTSFNQSPSIQMTLSKLTAVSVGYCWKEFDEDDWEFVLSQSRRWTESAVLVVEEIAENVNDAFSTSEEVIIPKLEEAVRILDPCSMNIARNALFTFSLFCGISELQQEEDFNISNSVKVENWSGIKDRIFEHILRIFFATGVTEAIASSSIPDGSSSIVASSRLAYSHFWELVASNVISSPQHVRDTAVQSMELWELSKGPISSLCAILFSSKPISSLQVAAYVMLSTNPISHSAIIIEEDAATCSLAGEESVHSHPIPDSSLDETVSLREEISCMIRKSPYELLEMDLIAHHRVNVFIAWALLLSHLQSLSSSSPARQRLVQWIQDFADTRILDCLFQHIPLKPDSLKKKDVELPAGVSEAATAAKRAITTGSLLFSVESLWPVGTEEMSCLAGAIYGMMLRALPAYVRDWFTSVRDRSTSSAIDFFTKSWCSPPLLADELRQIKKPSLADENFSVSVSKSAYEVVATYKKEETGMDLVIRLPLSYPLRPVDVDCTRSLGISDVKQRKWLMSMIAFVRSQNGALAEAIRTWKSNFDKEFEGIEECPICYSIIHTANNSVPRLGCKTCKHKYHAACLYKWFTTSHKSTCPLCQSPF